LFSILLININANQIRFVKILFHFSEVAVGIEFAREKKLFLTGFTHRKIALWKSRELDLLVEPLASCFINEKKVLKYRP
jgi:hypothetical protein